MVGEGQKHTQNTKSDIKSHGVRHKKITKLNTETCKQTLSHINTLGERQKHKHTKKSQTHKNTNTHRQKNKTERKTQRIQTDNSVRQAQWGRDKKHQQKPLRQTHKHT